MRLNAESKVHPMGHCYGVVWKKEAMDLHVVPSMNHDRGLWVVEYLFTNSIIFLAIL